jgi:hypothetical protein
MKGISSSRNRDFHNTTLIVSRQLFSRFDVFAYGDLDVGQGFVFSCSLRPAAGQTGAGDAVAFLGVAESDAIGCHEGYGTPFPIFERLVDSWTCVYSCFAHGS